VPRSFVSQPEAKAATGHLTPYGEALYNGRLGELRKPNKEDNQIMTTNITPLHDRVIVKRIDEGEQVRGGIIIPDSAKEKPQEGEVIAAGEGKYKEDGTRQPLDVKAGDRILFGKYTSSEIKIDGEELLIMREDEILGIITRAGAAAGGKKRK
jgi:chaperonin GroES